MYISFKVTVFYIPSIIVKLKTINCVCIKIHWPVCDHTYYMYQICITESVYKGIEVSNFYTFLLIAFKVYEKSGEIKNGKFWKHMNNQYRQGRANKCNPPARSHQATERCSPERNQPNHFHLCWELLGNCWWDMLCLSVRPAPLLTAWTWGLTASLSVSLFFFNSLVGAAFVPVGINLKSLT